MKIKKILFLVSFFFLYNSNSSSLRSCKEHRDEYSSLRTFSKWESAISLVFGSFGVCIIVCGIRDAYKKSKFKKKIKKLFQKTALKKILVQCFNANGHLFQVYNLVTSAQTQTDVSYSLKNDLGVTVSEGGGFCSAGMLQFKERVYVILYKLLSDLKLNADFLAIVKEIDRTSFVSFSIETVLLDVLSDTNFMLRLAATV